jgi:2-oxoglutarate ferredoxin oxidoreductase subunit delta
MISRIEIDTDRCKGCGLCTTACERKLLSLNGQESEAEYPFAVIQDPQKCVGCALCATICPDIAIKVFSRTRNSYALARTRSFAVVEKMVANGRNH